MHTPAQAVAARNRLLQQRTQGRTPSPRITPEFDQYAKHYLDWHTSTEAKSPLTIKVERWALDTWSAHFGNTRLSRITRRNINDYLAARKDECVTNRTMVA